MLGQCCVCRMTPESSVVAWVTKFLPSGHRSRRYFGTLPDTRSLKQRATSRT